MDVRLTPPRAEGAEVNKNTEYAENDAGVHVVNPLGSEHTLCGDAFDGDVIADGKGHRSTKKKIVTCPHCIAVINVCRGVKTSPTP